MKLRNACAVGLALSLLGWGSAEAQVTGTGYDGWYVRLEGGWNHLQQMTGQGSGNTLSFTTQHNEGWIGGGAAGYKFGQLRLELDVDYRENSVDKMRFGAPGDLPAGIAGTTREGAGRISAITEMINGYYDLNQYAPAPNWVPYIGLGMGVAALRLQGYGANGVNVAGDNDVVFAIEPKLGIRYMFSDSTALGFEYRFLNGFNPTFSDTGGGRFNTSDYRSHSLLVSFTWYLGGPPAPPPPTPAAAPAIAPAPAAAPAPAERQVFIVFFDFDKATITPAGKQIVAQAAQAYMRGHRVLLTGYTDLAGTQQYNLGLSKRRAEAVRAEMIADGVPATAINAAWKGKEDPRVPTPDGVREPQNRRVEIVLP
jgi:outer membrane protein OmpA-like peptidoglycan-associated protein